MKNLGCPAVFNNTFLSFAFSAPPLCVCVSACESAAVTEMSLTVFSHARERACRSVGGRVCAL